ncbi:hypothetical protein FI667_g10620, partial [Globisporangium splendens]
MVGLIVDFSLTLKSPRSSTFSRATPFPAPPPTSLHPANAYSPMCRTARGGIERLTEHPCCDQHREDGLQQQRLHVFAASNGVCSLECVHCKRFVHRSVSGRRYQDLREAIVHCNVLRRVREDRVRVVVVRAAYLADGSCVAGSDGLASSKVVIAPDGAVTMQTFSGSSCSGTATQNSSIPASTINSDTCYGNFTKYYSSSTSSTSSSSTSTLTSAAGVSATNAVSFFSAVTALIGAVAIYAL